MKQAKCYTVKIFCIVFSITILFSAVVGCTRESISITEEGSYTGTSTEPTESELSPESSSSSESNSAVTGTATSTTYQTTVEIPSAEPSESVVSSENDIDKMIPYGILFDTAKQEVLFSKNADLKVYPASLTKLVTACTALKYVPVDTVFTVGTEQSLVKPQSSLCLIQKGHKLTLHDLICGMLLASGNDAAYTVAVNTARSVYKDKNLNDEQAVKLFCQLMNEFAAQIGMNSSNFTNPDGWDDAEQYTTVNDLLKIAIYANGNSIINSIVSCDKKYVVFTSGQNITWKNSNKLLNENSEYYYPSATGMKTGTTKNAGKCLIASANKNGKTVIAIVMDCKTEEQRYSFAIHLFNKAFN